MAYCPNSIGLTLLYIFFGSLSPKNIMVLNENQYLGRFKAIKMSKFAEFPILKKC